MSDCFRRVVLGVLLSVAQPLVASAFEVECVVEAGYSGVIGNGGVFPVSVTLANKAISSPGLIEITQPDTMGAGDVLYVQPIVSPSPSVKRFELLVRAEPGRELELKVGFKENIRTIRQSIPVTQTAKPIILCLDLPQGYKLGATEGAYCFVKTSLESIRADPLALGGIYGVMLSGTAFSKLSVPQLEAIGQWLATGGRLILVEAHHNVDFDRNAGVMQADVSPGLHAYGGGLIAVAESSATPDVAFWEGYENLTNPLFPMNDKDEIQQYAGQNSGGGGLFGSFWKARRTYGWWGFFWIVLILGAYVAVIGPLDKWLVKRTRRPLLTWVLFPAFIVVFSLMAYRYSSIVNVGTMRAVYATVLDVAPDQGVARGNSMLWIYSVKNDSYEISSAVRNVFFSGREVRMNSGRDEVVIQNGVASLYETKIPIFSGRVLDAEWFAPWQTNITCSGTANDFKVVVPAALDVVAALLAEKEGVFTLQKGALPQEWIAFGAGESWTNTLTSVTRDLNRWNNNSLEEGDTKGHVPVQKLVENYLVAMSFPFAAEHNASSDYLYNKNSRESALDIRGRLRSGATLLLFLAPETSLMPVEVKGYSPEMTIANLIRIQIPDVK